MPERTPLLSLFGVRWNHVVPKPMRVIVGTQTRIDNINMLVLAQLFFDVGPFEENFLTFAPALLFLGEFDALQHELGVFLFDGLYFHSSSVGQIIAHCSEVKLNLSQRYGDAKLI
jgi:hypothetical protein